MPWELPGRQRAVDYYNSRYDPYGTPRGILPPQSTLPPAHAATVLPQQQQAPQLLQMQYGHQQRAPGNQIQGYGYQDHHPSAVQPTQNSTSRTSRASGISRKDFASVRPPPTSTSKSQGHARPPAHFTGAQPRRAGRTSGSRVPSTARSRRQPPNGAEVASSRTESRISGDNDRYTQQSSRRSFHTGTSRTSAGTWRPPPSTIVDHPQYLPTNREDSVAPKDSWSHYQRNEIGSQCSRTSDMSTDELWSAVRNGDTMPMQVGARARAPTISTIDTAELPDTVGQRSRPSAGKESRSSYQTANILNVNPFPTAAARSIQRSRTCNRHLFSAQVS